MPHIQLQGAPFPGLGVHLQGAMAAWIALSPWALGHGGRQANICGPRKEHKGEGRNHLVMDDGRVLSSCVISN